MKKKTRKPGRPRGKRPVLTIIDERLERVRRGACPVCGSDGVEGEGVEVREDGAAQECYCGDCGREWLAHYPPIDRITIYGRDEQINQ